MIGMIGVIHEEKGEKSILSGRIGGSGLAS